MSSNRNLLVSLSLILASSSIACMAPVEGSSADESATDAKATAAETTGPGAHSVKPRMLTTGGVGCDKNEDPECTGTGYDDNGGGGGSISGGGGGGGVGGCVTGCAQAEGYCAQRCTISNETSLANANRCIDSCEDEMNVCMDRCGW